MGKKTKREASLGFELSTSLKSRNLIRRRGLTKLSVAESLVVNRAKKEFGQGL